MKPLNGQRTPKNLDAVRERLTETYPHLNIPQRSYLVLMSPRSGSTLLCAHLANIGFGRPVEGFHFSNGQLTRMFGDEVDFSDPYAHIAAVFQYGTVNGIFGLKFSWVEFELFLKKARELVGNEQQDLTDMDLLDLFFPQARIVRLVRRNKIKQAVSYAKAMQTGNWNEEVDESEEYKDYIVPPKYNRAHIEALFDNLLAYDLSWEHFLNCYQRDSLEIWYEDLANDYEQVMSRIYQYLGVVNAEELQPPLKRQSNTINQQWVTRFEQETAWLQDPDIRGDLSEGNFQSVFFFRSRMMARKHERQVWSRVPYHHHKKLKRILYRLKLRLGLAK